MHMYDSSGSMGSQQPKVADSPKTQCWTRSVRNILVSVFLVGAVVHLGLFTARGSIAAAVADGRKLGKHLLVLHWLDKIVKIERFPRMKILQVLADIDLLIAR